MPPFCVRLSHNKPSFFQWHSALLLSGLILSACLCFRHAVCVCALPYCASWVWVARTPQSFGAAQWESADFWL